MQLSTSCKEHNHFSFLACTLWQRSLREGVAQKWPTCTCSRFLVLKAALRYVWASASRIIVSWLHLWQVVAFRFIQLKMIWPDLPPTMCDAMRLLKQLCWAGHVLHTLMNRLYERNVFCWNVECGTVRIALVSDVLSNMFLCSKAPQHFGLVINRPSVFLLRRGVQSW